MRISFDNVKSQNVDRVTNSYRNEHSAEKSRVFQTALDISGTVTDNAAYGVHGRTAEEIMQEAGNQDMKVLRNYMTVMSNSMSEEDFARMQRDGYHPGDMDIETVITIVDKIKAEMAKSGADIIGYTDDIDNAKLAEITGSETYARAIVSALRAEDVPVTESNVKQAGQAAEKAAELTGISEGTAKYMVSHAMEPTIENIYRAGYSGSADAGRQGRGYYSEELPGYMTKKAEELNMESLRPQMEKVIEQAGLSVTEETMTEARWLIEKGVPLTTDNLLHLRKLKEVELPGKQEEVLAAIAGALAEGKTADGANLYDGRSCYRKAAEADLEIDRLLKEAVSSGNVTARRQLEEVRLAMTVEANVLLLKSGFSIDTSKLEELVEALKAVEAQQAEKLFGDTKEPEASYHLYKETVAKTAEIPYLPADAAVRTVKEADAASLEDVYREGKAQQEAYRKAGESYETLMTEPRRDLGDSIRKAFRNVDDILSGMDLSQSDENRRAVRILGYNNMEITHENIQAVRHADARLQRVVEKLTPAETVNLIREGVNPLELSLEELDKYLGAKETYSEEADKYSRYLYRLEQNKEITPEEKEAYIGIYRMLKQIEKSDGAAIGSLVNSGASLSFGNLLSAVRSSKAKGMDYKIDDSFGVLNSVEKKLASITEQIAAGYTDGLTDQLEKQFEGEEPPSRSREMADKVSQIQSAEQDVLNMLRNCRIPITIDNLAAAAGIHKSGSTVWKKLQNTLEKADKKEAGNSLDQMTDHPEEVFASGEEGARETYGEFIGAAMEITGEQTFDQDMSSVDVKSLKLLHKQLSLVSKAAEYEEYYIPVMIEGEMTSVHLKLEHGEENKGTVSISMEHEKTGKAQARFSADASQVNGYMWSGTDEMQERLNDMAEKMKKALNEDGWECGRIDVMKSDAAGEKAGERKSGNAAGRDLYRLAKTFITVYRESGILHDLSTC